MGDGVANTLFYHGVGTRRRAFIKPFPDSTWVTKYQEWWPVSASALALYYIRDTKGVNAYCEGSDK